MRRSYCFIGLAAAVLAIAPAMAQAACSTDDLQGLWDAYSVGADGDGVYWERCQVRFNASARIQSGACIDDEGDGSTLSGRLSLKRNCRIGGTVTQQFSGESLRCSLKATLSTGKESAAGVGECNDGAIFSLDLIKR